MGDPASGSLLKADLQKSIAKLEEVWEGEVSTLKHELWQTIQAPNHNADLLKHHKDAIDAVQNENQPNPELEQIHAQLVAVDKVLQREQAKEQQMEQLMQRLMQVQHQWTVITGSWTGAAAPPNFPQHAVGGAVAANAGAAGGGKKPKAKGGAAKSKAKAPSQAQQQAAAAAASLRAEAPEFVPTGFG